MSRTDQCHGKLQREITKNYYSLDLYFPVTQTPYWYYHLCKNMERFCKILVLRIVCMKKTKQNKVSVSRKDGRTDNVKTVYPDQSQFARVCGGWGGGRGIVWGGWRGKYNWVNHGIIKGEDFGHVKYVCKKNDRSKAELLLWFIISIIVYLCIYVLVIFFLFWIAVEPLFGKETVFLLSACCVLILIPLLLVRPAFLLVSWTQGVKMYRFLVIAFPSV